MTHTIPILFMILVSPIFYAQIAIDKYDSNDDVTGDDINGDFRTDHSEICAQPARIHPSAWKPTQAQLDRIDKDYKEEMQVNPYCYGSLCDEELDSKCIPNGCDPEYIDVELAQNPPSDWDYTKIRAEYLLKQIQFCYIIKDIIPNHTICAIHYNADRVYVDGYDPHTELDIFCGNDILVQINVSNIEDKEGDELDDAIEKVKNKIQDTKFAECHQTASGKFLAKYHLTDDNGNKIGESFSSNPDYCNDVLKPEGEGEYQCLLKDNEIPEWTCMSEEGCLYYNKLLDRKEKLERGGQIEKSYIKWTEENDKEIAKCNGQEQPEKNFDCYLRSSGQKLWTCIAPEGCQYKGELLNKNEAIGCIGIADNTDHGCFCNGVKRNYADESICEAKTDEFGDRYTLDEMGNRHYLERTIFSKVIQNSQTCNAANGCLCHNQECPMSGICSDKGCLEPISNQLFEKKAGYWVAGLYNICSERSGCSCGEHQCKYGEGCVNDWYCTDELETTILDNQRLVYQGIDTDPRKDIYIPSDYRCNYQDDGTCELHIYYYDSPEENKALFEKYSVHPKNRMPYPVSLKTLDTNEYMGIGAKTFKWCVYGQCGESDEIAYRSFDVPRCVLAGGCSCGNTKCPAYAMCVEDACYYDTIYEGMMCSDYVEPRCFKFGELMKPATQVDTNGMCLDKNDVPHPPKFVKNDDNVFNFNADPSEMIGYQKLDQAYFDYPEQEDVD